MFMELHTFRYKILSPPPQSKATRTGIFLFWKTMEVCTKHVIFTLWCASPSLQLDVIDGWGKKFVHLWLAVWYHRSTQYLLLGFSNSIASPLSFTPYRNCTTPHGHRELRHTIRIRGACLSHLWVWSLMNRFSLVGWNNIISSIIRNGDL